MCKQCCYLSTCTHIYVYMLYFMHLYVQYTHTYIGNIQFSKCNKNYSVKRLSTTSYESNFSGSFLTKIRKGFHCLYSSTQVTEA